MSTAPKAAAFAVLLRILFSGFPTYEHRWAALIWIIAALSMFVGNLGALLQRDVKRMLAYTFSSPTLPSPPTASPRPASTPPPTPP